MVRRNRACAPCRQRRIRCDETYPKCQQCIRGGRDCPGPDQGPVMVDMTSSVVDRVRQPQTNAQKRAQFAPAYAIETLPNHAAIMQMFVTRYLTYFCGSSGDRRKPWMLRQYGDKSTAGLPLQAAALAHYATEASQPDAEVKSRDIYITALGKHRSLVGQALNGRWSQESLAVEMVSSNLLLGYFEASQGLDAGAYSLHVHAAAAFLHRIGPEGCRSGLLNQLFYAVRAQLPFIAFTTQKPILFTSPEWLDLPYGKEPLKPLSELVMDIIILLINTSIQKSCQDEISELEIRLLTLWDEYEMNAKIERANIQHYNSTNHNYADDSLALTILYFSSAAMLLPYALKPSITPPTASFRLVDPSNMALACIKYLEKRVIGCAYLRMMLPLSLVLTKSESENQRDQAYNTLETWKLNRIVPGLCKLAENILPKDYRADARALSTAAVGP